MDDSLDLVEKMLEAVAKTMRKFRAHLDSQDSRADILEHRIALLEQSRAKRLDAIEQRIAVQGDSMSYRIANVGDLAVTNFKKISAIEQQGVVLAQRCEMRITSIEERLAALEKLETNDNWK